MSKKIAIALIMIMLVNTGAFADDDTGMLVLYAVGISLVVLGAVILPMVLMAEADAPVT